MKNLAGDKNADAHIKAELNRCGIPIESIPLGPSEVPYTLIGKLGEFTFTRAWYYWCVSGPVPLALAESLYTEEFKCDIRSGGDCVTRPPLIWATYIHEGKQVITQEEYKSHVDLASKSPLYKKILESEDFKLRYYILPDDDLSSYKQYVTSYHIDSELGLYVFVQAIKSLLNNL